ncbi:hypothetical protein QBC34DRAFT_457439 [Podospora aff. communis PSN243]|uniref:Uncharacterized protein n=1 Tax=Podospora aff. communis PSN243 TaxID=3040156 RepID=A0AAV9G413_9PEZI|nr:hypothetical protein QBC34DRAFT_457439 [Podospora aff. communis PSN243]
MRIFVLLAVFSAAALADHMQRGALEAVQCLGYPGSGFCSSFLHIPDTTTTTLVQTPTEFVPQLFMSHVSVVISTTTFSDPGCVPVMTLRRRDAGPESTLIIPCPPALKRYPYAVISWACSHLHVSPRATITITSTAKIHVTSTVGITSTTTVCIGQPPCTDSGDPCDLDNPGACCSVTCINGFPTPFCA